MKPLRNFFFLNKLRKGLIKRTDAVIYYFHFYLLIHSLHDAKYFFLVFNIKQESHSIIIIFV